MSAIPSTKVVNYVALKTFFRVGLNDPIRSHLPGGKIHWSLEKYIDHALLLSGSLFIVGIAGEKHSYPTVPTTPEQFMSGVVHVMSAKPETAHVMSTNPGPTHI